MEEGKLEWQYKPIQNSVNPKEDRKKTSKWKQINSRKYYATSKFKYKSNHEKYIWE